MTFVGQGLWEGASLSAAGDTTLRSFPGDSHFLPLSPGKSWEIRNYCLQSRNWKHNTGRERSPAECLHPQGHAPAAAALEGEAAGPGSGFPAEFPRPWCTCALDAHLPPAGDGTGGGPRWH